MRKYIAVLIVLILLAGLAIWHLIASNAPVTPSFSGPAKHLTITIPYHSWSFDPNFIEVDQNELLALTIVNHDDIEHGFAIDEYRVNVSVPPGATVQVPEFKATTEGEMHFYCSVICGEGDVTVGSTTVHRGHFDMNGILRVKAPGAQSNASVWHALSPAHANY